MKIKLTPAAQASIKAQQHYIASEIGVLPTPTEAVEAMVKSHCNLSDMLGVDAAVFGAAVESLIQRGGGRTVAAVVEALGVASGYWSTKTPAPEDVPAPSYADLLRAKADEVEAAEHYVF